VFVVAAVAEFFRKLSFLLFVPFEPHIHCFLTGLCDV
jgi:hypothetical protein